MAGDVKSLLVKLDANIQGLVKGLDDAGVKLGSFTATANQSAGRAEAALNGLAQAGNTVRNALGALGIGIGIGALVNIGKAALDLGSDLNDAADQIGVTAEQLQVYRLAASESGVQSEQLDKGLRGLTTTIGNAVTGSKEAQDKFKALGIAFTNADGSARGTNAVLKDLADRIKSISNPAEQAAASAELLGDRIGAKLVPLLRQGRAGLDEFAKSAKASGDVLSNELAARLDAAQERIERFKNSIVVAAGETLGALDDFSNKATEEAVSKAGARIDQAKKNYDAAIEKLNKAKEALAAYANAKPNTDESDAFTYYKKKVDDLAASAEIARKALSDLTASNLKRLEGVSAPLSGRTITKPNQETGQKVFDFADNKAKIAIDELREQYKLQGLSEEKQAELKAIDEFRAKYGDQLTKTYQAQISAIIRQGYASKEVNKTLEDRQRLLAKYDFEGSLVGKTKFQQDVARAQFDAKVEPGSADGQRIAQDLQNKTIAENKNQLDEFIKKQRESLETSGLEEGARQKIENRIEAANRAIDAHNIGLRKSASLTADEVKMIDALYDATQQAAEAAKKLADNKALAKTIFEQTRTPLEKYNDQLEHLNELIAEGLISQDTFGRAQEQIRDQLEQSQLAASGFQQVFQTAGEAIGTAFEDAVLEGKKSTDILKGLVKDLERTFLRVAVTNPLEKIFGNLAQGLIGGIGGGSASGGAAPNFAGGKFIGGAGSNSASSSGLFSFIGNLFGFADGGIMTSAGPLKLQKYASGGIATSPQLAMFGERGPEAYVPIPAGRIPVELRGGMGGMSVNSTVNINVNGNAGTPQQNNDFAQKLSPVLKAALDRSIQQIIMNQTRPGGLFNR